MSCLLLSMSCFLIEGKVRKLELAQRAASKIVSANTTITKSLKDKKTINKKG